MIIDCHGHYTTAPKALETWRRTPDRRARGPEPRAEPGLARDQRRRDPRRPSKGRSSSLQRERGTDLTIFSPRAAGMGHHIGNATTSRHWSAHCNDLIHRVCALYPENFVGVCQLPQSPGVAPSSCIAELERCVNELGFVGCNLNPDPSGGYWTDPPLTDRWWYPLYEKMVELDVPAMVHVSASCNPELPRHRRALHQRRHDGLHAVPDLGPLQGFPDAANSSSRMAAARCPITGAAIAAWRRT